MPSYEEIKQEIFAHETPADPAVSIQESPQVQMNPSPSPRNRVLAVQILVVSLLATIVCGGTLWYMNGTDAPKSKVTRETKKEPFDFMEWLVGGSDKRSSIKNRKRGNGLFGSGLGAEREISVIRSPDSGFAETN